MRQDLESNMKDSEIQYIGNWSPQQVLSSSPASLSALILTTMTEDDMKSSLTLSRNQSSVVYIGRSLNNTREHECSRATYTNPVMSRNHAKIIFSNSGTVSLADTNSHHGTWVNRKGDDIKLKPEVHFCLEDGDKIRFGKEVVKDGNTHKPLVLSVKLIFNPSTPSARSDSSSISPADTTRLSRARNRFGLSSSSESEVSSSSEEEPCDVGREIISAETSSSLFGPSSPQSSAECLPLSPLREPLPPIDPGVEAVNSQAEVHSIEGIMNIQASCTPPWRRFSHSPWLGVTTSFFKHVPDILPRPFSRSDYLFGSRASKSDTGHQDFDASHCYLPPVPSQGHTHAHGHHPNRHDLNDHTIINNDEHKEEGKGLHEDIRMIREELQSLRDTVSRLDESHISIDRAQSLINNLENQIPALSLKTSEEHMSSIKSSLKSIEETIFDFKQMITTFQSHIAVSNNRFHILQKNIAKTQSLQDKLDSLDSLYRSEMNKWDLDHAELKHSTHEVESIREDMEHLRSELKRLDTKLFQDGLGAMGENALECRLKDYVTVELARLVDVETHSVLGKRKRSNEDHVDVPVQTEPPMMLPPTKKTRISRYLVAGTIGALGAWVGLAYL